MLTDALHIKGSLHLYFLTFFSFSFCSVSQGKRSILRKADSERIDHSMRVKFNPLALLLDSSLEGEYDLVQRVIYDVSRAAGLSL